MLIGGGYGTMGCALPYAIGASISTDKGVVYCITGDGGLQMNIQELETVKRENIPVKILVLNNKVLGKISETQHLNHNDRYAQTTKKSGYTVPDFKKISEAYGIKAAEIKSFADLEQYSLWFLDNDPCLIDIHLSEESLLLPKIKWETGEIKPQIDASITERVSNILKC